VRSELDTLLNALITLTPSRNYLIQLFRLLPANFDSISATYPEFFDDPVARDVLSRAFGLLIGDWVELGTGLARDLTTWSEHLTETFSQDESEKRWKALSTSYKLEVPNALAEWVETKTRMTRTEPRLGSVADKMLHSLLGRESVTLSDLMAHAGSDERTARSAINLLERMALVERANPRGGGESIKLKTGYSAASQSATLEGIQRASKP
jgi:hypothetical protein